MDKSLIENALKRGGKQKMDIEPMKVLAGLSTLTAIAGFSAVDACGDPAFAIGLAGWAGTFVFGSVAERRAK